MTKPATLILHTTRAGSRSAVLGLNQSQHVRKVEPNRRRWGRLWPRRGKVSPDQKGPRSRGPWTDASSLLVILHYLLKNNTSFMGGIGAGEIAPRDSCWPTGQRKFTSHLGTRGHPR